MLKMGSSAGKIAFLAGAFLFLLSQPAFSNMPYPYPIKQAITDSIFPIAIFYILTCIIEAGIAYYFLVKKDLHFAKLTIAINLVSWPIVWFGLNPVFRGIEYNSTVFSVLLCEIIAITGESVALFYLLKKKRPFKQMLKSSVIMNAASAAFGIAFLLLYTPVFRQFVRAAFSWLEF